MIIFRYLSREVLVTMVAVSSTLLLIIMSGRFVKYLAEAASGELAVDILFAIMGYRLPGFLELVVPLGFFIAVLLAYGRLYMDSEMVVLSACGFSQKQLLMATMVPTVVVAVLIGSMSLWVSPWGAAETEKLFAQQRERAEFTALREGHFQRAKGGRQVTYVEDLSQDRTRLNTLFVADMTGPVPSVALADHGDQALHPEYGQRYLRFFDGVRYSGRPGRADYEITEFDMLAQRMQEPEASNVSVTAADAKTTPELWNDTSPASRAALQWRLSMPLLVLIVGVLSVPLSRTSPRQGRYIKMLPAILLYLFYVAALSAARSAVEEGDIPPVPGLWAVHAVFATLALVICVGPGVLWHGVLRRGADR